ncbi:sensor histidine kinase [Tenacibaculum agarivorans]|uniref:sensor histidine kinase n=1 Tax=Tenacibaculum agarivorans TaxID=1908389 RepID=UPI0009FA7300|nr:sensor histidine kinase [Tenacibaculum agarivorans]
MLFNPHFFAGIFFQKRLPLVVALFFVLLSFAQQTYTYHFTTNEGLPSNETYKVYEDAHHFIWIATDKGVSKYNGYEFINYTVEDGLGDNTIFNFYEDTLGRLWFLSFNGKLSYYFNGKIYAVDYDIHYNDIGHIKSLYLDAKNILWIGSAQGEFKATFSTQNKLKVTPTKEQYALRQIDDKGYIFSGKHYKKNNEISYAIKLLDNEYILNYSQEGVILPSKKTDHQTRKSYAGISWLIHNNVIYNSYNHQALIFDLNSKTLKTIHFKFEGRITGTVIEENKNQYVFNNMSRKKIFAILDSPPFIKPIETKDFFFINAITDHQGGTWTATHDKGVFYEPKTIIYNIHANAYENEAIVNMVSNSSSLYLRSENSNIFKLLNNYKFAKIKNALFNRLHGRLYNFRDTIAYNDIIDATLKTIDHKPLFHHLPKGGYISSFNDNQFTLYSRLKIHMFNKHRQPLFSYSFSKENIAIQNICYKDKNTIYIASRQGLWEVNDTWKIFFKGDENPIFKTRIDKINKDKTGRFWMITKEKGVIVIDKDSVINITTNIGLLGNICTGLYIGKKRVWVATEKGLSGIKLDDYTNIDNFTQKDGLISNQINDIHEFDNKIWVASDKGLSYIHTDYSKKTYIPKIFIEKVNIDDNLVTNHKNIIIPPNNNLLQINYLGLSYREQGDLQYKYRLKGLDTTWRTTKNRSVQYSTLPAGNYTFEIKAVNHQGVSSTEIGTLNIIKKPHFWETLHFILSSLLIFIFLIVIFVYYRIKRIKKREYLKQRVIKTELKLLRSQMNPHFTFNAMNSIQYYIQENNTDKALHFIYQFSSLIRRILQHTQRETISLDQEIEALKLYVTIEKERLKNAFSFHITIHDNVDVKTTRIAPMLLQPYVENAIWHGIMPKNDKNGIISLTIYTENNRLICEIVDNGVGRQASCLIKNPEKESLGMDLLKERLYLINNNQIKKQTTEITDIFDAHQNNCGTKVKLTL